MNARSNSKSTSQTVRINGARVRLVTTNGKVTTKPAPMLEEDMQAAMATALRKMPEYGKRFLFAGDMNAERRGHKARSKAVKTGMAAGEPDMRIYGEGGRLLLVENKVGNSSLTDSQERRHPALAVIGHPVTIVRATTPEDAAALVVELVRGWLGVGLEKVAA
ncbi:VRR-NUC domain-containing protein [Mesorhizobium sp. B2-2-4]|uniref:VRR-NUC domain-containing protein n=1 Tax=unclassified Mesorhizobium TaxID=325217 RepID=UPI001127C49D|nr:MULTISPECIES: VRR-NUC domain-containing protein [unclassified Mesorhizobium]TPM58994.1 VRR-NUC domain-containing protein [Mesorhizobium sp. B2-2-4]TPM67479.1 VRR-NUC domain-containing protein [Mesorhizobium sp. B2-2-1]